MSGFNQVTLMGNITRDPQTRTINGTNIVEFGIAVGRVFKSAGGETRNETCFVDCTAFGKQADTLARWTRKGRPLLVRGRLRYDTWEDAVTKARRSKLSVVVEDFAFIGPRDAEEGDTAAPGRSAADSSAGDDASRRSVKVKQADIPF